MSNERFRYPRKVLAAAVVAAFAIASSTRVLVKEQKQAEGPRDSLTRYEDRFERLRRRLPSVGEVGYVGSPGENKKGTFDPFYAAQYALAPVVLVRRTDLPLVVGNFDPSNVSSKRPVDPPLVLIEDFGNGVMLFRREAR